MKEREALVNDIIQRFDYELSIEMNQEAIASELETLEGSHAVIDMLLSIIWDLGHVEEAEQ